MDSVWENEIELEIILGKEVKMTKNVKEGPISWCLYLREHRFCFLFVFIYLFIFWRPEDLEEDSIFNEDSITYLVLGLVLSPLPASLDMGNGDGNLPCLYKLIVWIWGLHERTYVKS